MKRLWRSPTLRSAAVLGLSGLGFAVANLLLARVLPKAEYAFFTLVVALVNVGYPLAPGGVDGVVNRRRLEAGPRLLRRTMGTIAPVGIVFAAIALAAYRTSPFVTLLIAISTMAGGALLVAGGQFQSEQRFGISLALNQSPNLVLLLSALWVVTVGASAAETPLAIWTAGFVVAAFLGWWVLFRERHDKPHRSIVFPWAESLAIAGLSVAGLLLIQLERLLIPYLLPVADLATYGVLAAIVGSFFRVLQMGVGYSLLPRLRAAAGVSERRRLIAKEARLLTAIVLLGSAAIWIATPALENWFLAGKYHLSGGLILAALVTGVVKILNGFAQSTVSALADHRELSVVSVLGWLAVAVAVGAAIVGARWGLAGVIYGVGIGWLARASAALFMAARHLRLPAAAPVATS